MHRELLHNTKLTLKVVRATILIYPLYISGYRLVIIYAAEEIKDSHFVSKLQNFRRAFIPHHNIDAYRDYLSSHFKREQQQSSSSAALVDHEKYVMFIVVVEYLIVGCLIAIHLYIYLFIILARVFV